MTKRRKVSVQCKHSFSSACRNDKNEGGVFESFGHAVLQRAFAVGERITQRAPMVWVDAFSSPPADISGERVLVLGEACPHALLTGPGALVGARVARPV